MTIFHVLKYNPREICNKVADGTHPFHTLIPEDINELYTNKMTAIWRGRTSVSFDDYIMVLRETLMEYEGPI